MQGWMPVEFALAATYLENKAAVDVAMQHLFWRFEAWARALDDRVVNGKGRGGNGGGLTFEPKYA